MPNRAADDRASHPRFFDPKGDIRNVFGPSQLPTFVKGHQLFLWTSAMVAWNGCRTVFVKIHSFR